MNSSAIKTCLAGIGTTSEANLAETIGRKQVRFASRNAVGSQLVFEKRSRSSFLRLPTTSYGDGEKNWPSQSLRRTCPSQVRQTLRALGQSTSMGTSRRADHPRGHIPCVKQQTERMSSNDLSWEEDAGRTERVPCFIEGKRLSEISTWGIGGPAKMFIEVRSEEEMANVLRYCNEHGVRLFIVGNGSNCLFDDRGYDGCIILNRIDFVKNLGQGRYRVGAGHAFNHLGVTTSKDGFSGLEFACGIPGTVGGAVFMNAGADGQETANTLSEVDIVTIRGDRQTLSRERAELAYGYRLSPFQKLDGFAAVVAATFELQHCSKARERQVNLMQRRRKTQPIMKRTAGCVFRNPGTGDESAGALIDKLGLKGLAIGDARVSDLHANFLINQGKSTSADMLALIALIKENVKRQTGINLQEEIRVVPYM